MKMTQTIAVYGVLVGALLGTTLVETSQADPLDKSSPKIAHGMYRDRGKSSPKIAHGMRRDVLRYEIELAFERGDFGLAFELLDELDPRLGRPPVRR